MHCARVQVQSQRNLRLIGITALGDDASLMCSRGDASGVTVRGRLRFKIMPLPASFFYHVMRPGRYLGGDMNGFVAAPNPGAKSVVWFYPGRYERAIADPAWRRGFFQLAGVDELSLSRGVEYARDVWDRLTLQNLPPFALGGCLDLRHVDTIVFWVTDPLTAAHIPSILKRLRLDSQRPAIGVVVDGWWAPRFLKDHVDWIIPAPSAWMPLSLVRLLKGDPQSAASSDGLLCASANWDSIWSGQAAPPRLIPSPGARTPSWIPRADVDGAMLDVELIAVGEDGSLGTRSVEAIVADTLAGLRETGAEGVRFCDSGFDCSQTIATTLMELSRLHNMKRIQADLPAMTAGAFDSFWKSYKPHLLKPVLRLRVAAGDDPRDFIEAGRRALNDGWRGLTAVMQFGSFDQFSLLLPVVQEIVQAWAGVTATYTDKRPLRLEYTPSPIDHWQGEAAEPREDDFRRLSSESRHFREHLSSLAAVGHFRIEDVIARNWLAASGAIWPDLAELDLADPNNDDAPPFDWCNWVRTGAGLAGAPQVPFARCKRFAPTIPPPLEAVSSVALTTRHVAATAADQLFGRRKQRVGFSRRLASPTRIRLRVQWGKTSDWRFYSHLDMVRAIERAIRKAGLPAGYSEGFHPRLKLSFGPPLSFGLISSAEYFDVVLERGVEPADIESLGQSLANGVFVVDAQGMPAQIPSLTEILNEATYLAELPLSAGQAAEAIQRMLSEPRLQWSRPDRPDRRPFDPRVSLRSASIEEKDGRVIWNLSVALGGEGNIRPTDWASLIFGFNAEEIAGLVIERTAMRIRLGEQTKTPFEFP